jgi:hypothetical protein
MPLGLRGDRRPAAHRQLVRPEEKLITYRNLLVAFYSVASSMAQGHATFGNTLLIVISQRTSAFDARFGSCSITREPDTTI